MCWLENMPENESSLCIVNQKDQELNPYGLYYLAE